MTDKPKRNSLKFCKNVKAYFRKYCNSTSIHGVRYFGDQNCTICEKIWWAIAILVSITFCFFLIIDTYQKWKSSPVIVSLATTETPIWEIPFPAITICPGEKTKPNLFNYSKILLKMKKGDNVTQEEIINFDRLSLVCNNKDNVKHTSEFESDDLYEFYQNVSKHLKYRIILLPHNDDSFMRRQNFTTVLTKDGICYTYNLLHKEEIFTETVSIYKNFYETKQKSSNWNLESGYSDEDDAFAYPRRIFSSGVDSALTLVITTFDWENDYACSGGVEGHKVHVHHPAQLPQTKHNFFRVPRDQAVVASVLPQMIQTSPEIQSYSPDKRGCFFALEKNLKYFKFYSQINCQIECKTNITLHLCGCVHFSMPHDNSTLLCGAAKKGCMIQAESLTTKTRNATIKCKCLPSCTSVNYFLETSQSDYSWKKRLAAEDFHTYNRRMNMSLLKIFFKADYFIPMERHEMNSRTELVANFGGLLGLFTGFSLLSLVEIIYFMTLRIYCNVRRYGKKFWPGLPDDNIV